MRKKFGFRILVSSEKMDTREAMEAYSKRDCVEKVFSALKSTLGMEKIGVYSDDSIHTKMLIWFLAAILHSLIFNRTMELREKTERVSLYVPSLICSRKFLLMRTLTQGNINDVSNQ